MAGFDWTSFATAFMNTAAVNITKNKDNAATWQQQQEALALKNVAVVQKRQALVDRANGYYTYLADNGATNAQIQAALETGPDGIVKFAEKVAQAVADRGGQKLTAADTATIISLPDTFRPLELDSEGMKDYIAKTYGMGGVSKGVGEDADVSMWDRMTGRGAKELARARLDSKAVYDGYTSLDLNELAQTSDYVSLNPGTMASFLDYRYATPDIVYKANSQVDALITDMRQSDPYKAAVKQLEVVRGKEISIGAAYSREQYEADLKVASDKLIEMHRSAAGATAKKWMDMYGTSMQESMGSAWGNLFGADFFDMQEEEEPTVSTATDPLTATSTEELPTVVETPLTPIAVPSVTEVSSVLEEEGAAPEVVTVEEGNESVTFKAPGNNKLLTFVVNAEGKVISAKGEGNADFDLATAQLIWDEKKAKATELKAQQVETPTIAEPVIEEAPLTPLQQRLTERGADFTDDRDPAIQKSMDFVAAELDNPTTNAYGIKIKGRMPTFFTTASNLSMIPIAAIESGNVTILDIKDVPGKKQSLTKSGIQSYLKPYFDDAKAEGLMSKPAEPEAPEVKLPGLKLEDAKQLKFMLTRLNAGDGPASVEDVRAALEQYAEMRKQGFVDAQDNVIEPSTTALPKTEAQLNKLAELLYTEYK